MSSVKITVRPNGPYLIEGTASYLDADGNRQSAPGKSLALCRCGNTQNSPFCDGSHKSCDYQAPGLDLDVETS